MGMYSTEGGKKSAKCNPAYADVRGETEIVTLSSSAESQASGDGFQAVDDLVDLINERAHRFADY